MVCVTCLEWMAAKTQKNTTQDWILYVTRTKMYLKRAILNTEWYEVYLWMDSLYKTKLFKTKLLKGNTWT